jgi:genome maintenance exonuclease 1
MFKHVQMEHVLPELECETLPTGRTYVTPEGNKYPSITTVLGELSKASILQWRKRVGDEEANKISTQASVRGTAVHQLAEDYLNNKPDWAKGAMPSNLHSFNQIKPILDERVDNIWQQEIPLYSDVLEMAGRVDCIAELDGVLTIIDFKTSRKPKKVEWIQNYFMQGTFYAASFLERTGVAIKQTAIIIAVDGSEPQVFIEPVHKYLKPLADARKNYKNIHGF